jgi:hypothetical protein
MFKQSVTRIIAASFLAILFGCTTSSSGTVSPATAETELDLQSIAPGVSAGDHANQYVVYVSDKAGADWLRTNTQQEYDTLFAQYTRSGDSTLLSRLSYLQATLRAADANAGSPFVITSIVDSNFVGGPSCSGGDGSTCTCSSGCFCVSAGRGCGCDCSQQN